VGVIAAAFLASVIGISDGDTLTIQFDREPVRVRIAEIDAPEKKQPFGTRSKQSLAELCFGKLAEITPQTKDRYGRTVARVSCNGQDVSEYQLKNGMAWVFDRYVTDRSLYGIQDEARQARQGLWSDGNPVPPWEWRKH
jgi:endonuclease YncB( thermonuclease family)